MGDKTSFEQEVRRSLDFIEDVAGAALKFDRLTADDREIIKKGLARVRPAFDELAKWFIEPLRQTKPSNVEYGYEKLYELVSWAWALGAKADVPESADSYVHSRHAKGERPLKPINKAILDLLQSGQKRANVIQSELIKNPPAGVKGQEIEAFSQSAFSSRVSRIKSRKT